MSDIASINNNESIWTCPVCKASCNTSGEPFASAWSVACHIAGKITGSSERTHKSWALGKVPDLDAKATLPKIAERLTWAVVEAKRVRDAVEESRRSEMEKEPRKRIITIERELHQFIQINLKREFGESGDDWWIKGIPLQIRQKCADKCEADNRSQHAYYYTDLIDLKPILDNNWRLFEGNLRRVRDKCKSKNELLDALGKLNHLRNTMFHGARQKDELSPEDNEFLDWFASLIAEFIYSD